MSERVLGVIGVYRKTFLGQKEEQLVFTTDRIIVARLGGGVSAASVGAGMFGAIGGAVGAAIEARKSKETRKKEEELTNMSPEDVLKANENNYAIRNLNIRQIEVKKKRLSIEITNDEKRKWRIGNAHLELDMNLGHLTPAERKKLEGLYEIVELGGHKVVAVRKEAMKDFEELNPRMTILERILRAAFPENMLSIKN